MACKLHSLLSEKHCLMVRETSDNSHLKKGISQNVQKPPLKTAWVIRIAVLQRNNDS